MTPEQANVLLRQLAQAAGKSGNSELALQLELIAGMVLEQERIINELRKPK